ncbi:MAG: Tim44 domain-containing protein [Alphaproteobacteria bacterium]|nr:Tim44 domain-containing protein [Alphaproteobacteria bacterium]
MPADLIVYALVAAGLVFWLRNILGTNHEEESERPNTYISPESTDTSRPDVDRSEKPQSAEQQIIALADDKRSDYGVDNKTAENGLIDIAKADRDFDVEFFLQGAQDAFAMIVEAFAAGDRIALKELLAEEVFKAFDGAIEEREEKGHTQVTDIHAIRKAMITKAYVQGKKAFITVKFTADESSVTRDAEGNTIAGDPDRVTKMNDIWTFGREIRSKNPAWLVYETRGDIEDDNDLIPDSH